MRVLNGAAAEAVFVMEVDSFEQAEQWYASDESRALKHLRRAAADFRGILVAAS